MAFGVITIPKETKAAYGGYISSINVDPAKASGDNPKPEISSINPSSSNLGVGTKIVTIFGEGFIPNSIGRINDSNRPTTFIDSFHLLMQISGDDISLYRSNGGFYITVFNPTPGGGYSSAAFFKVNKTYVPGGVTIDANGTSSNYIDTVQTDNGNNNANANKDVSDLASNAIFGSNTFYPSGLIQWILFAILILLIVILVRKIYGADKKYHSTPMKHD